MSCLPERAYLLGLLPGRKGSMLQGQGNQRFEMLHLGVGAAGFPLPHGPLGEV